MKKLRVFVIPMMIFASSFNVNAGSNCERVVHSNFRFRHCVIELVQTKCSKHGCSPWENVRHVNTLGDHASSRQAEVSREARREKEADENFDYREFKREHGLSILGEIKEKWNRIHNQPSK